MTRFRYHIGTLVILVLVLGVAFAALRESNDMWDSGVFTLTVGTFLTSVLRCIHQTEKRRAFWLGFALFGAAYLALSLIPSIESRLLSTKALKYLDSKLPRSTPNGVGVAYADFDSDGDMDIYVANDSQSSALYVNNGNGTFADVTMNVGLNYGAKRVVFNNVSGPWVVGTTENLVRIGHSLLALIVALVGAMLSRYLYGKERGIAGSN
jgi:hypothetical protein